MGKKSGTTRRLGYQDILTPASCFLCVSTCGGGRRGVRVPWHRFSRFSWRPRVSKLTRADRHFQLLFFFCSANPGRSRWGAICVVSTFRWCATSCVTPIHPVILGLDCVILAMCTHRGIHFHMKHAPGLQRAVWRQCGMVLTLPQLKVVSSPLGHL